MVHASLVCGAAVCSLSTGTGTSDQMHGIAAAVRFVSGCAITMSARLVATAPASGQGAALGVAEPEPMIQGTGALPATARTHLAVQSSIGSPSPSPSLAHRSPGGEGTDLAASLADSLPLSAGIVATGQIMRHRLPGSPSPMPFAIPDAMAEAEVQLQPAAVEVHLSSREVRELEPQAAKFLRSALGSIGGVVLAVVQEQV